MPTHEKTHYAQWGKACMSCLSIVMVPPRVKKKGGEINKKLEIKSAIKILERRSQKLRHL